MGSDFKECSAGTSGCFGLCDQGGETTIKGCVEESKGIITSVLSVWISFYLVVWLLEIGEGRNHIWVCFLVDLSLFECDYKVE